MLKQISINSSKKSVKISVALGALLLSLGAAGEESGDLANGEKMRIGARLVRAGVTGALILGTEQNQPHYAVEGSNLVIYTHKLPQGYNRLTVSVQYGTNEVSSLLADIYVAPGATDGEKEVEVTLDAVKTVGGTGGGGGGMEQYILTLSDGRIRHNGEPLTFAQVKAAVQDTSKFVYLQFANAFHLPCFIVSAEGRQSVEFTSSFVIGGEAHIERVIINEQEEINVDNVQTLRINEDGGVAFGENSEAISDGAFAHGYNTTASGDYSHAEGTNTTASGEASHAEGRNTTASGDYSHAEGEETTASGESSHAEGIESVAEGDYSHAEGTNTTASGDYSHAEGSNTTASGESSHAEGIESVASGESSHAEGEYTTASGYASHAEGRNTTASGESSHAEGIESVASGEYSHAEGIESVAEGDYSHAEGSNTTASVYASHAQGMYNSADDFDGEDGAFMHGCGTDNDDRKNAFAIAADGSIYVIGLGGYDGTNHGEAQSLQEIFGSSIIQASANTNVNGYQVPQLTPEQVAQAYNSVVAGKSATITDATGNFHLGVMQADNLSGDLTISVIYLNVMLVSYTIDGGSVDIQYKNL